jgi:hypothetical protein
MLQGLGFETSGHNIARLPVRLPSQRYVTFQADRPIDTPLQNNKQTMLTEFFKMNLTFSAAPQNNFTYFEHYAWHQKAKTWMSGKELLGWLLA